jgi:creatinine amidohydrolase
LPLDTDATIATAVAEGVAARLPALGGALVAPAIGYAASGEHQSFPGTISIGDQALRLVLVELVRSLSTWSGRVVFVNGHGGNVRSLSAAVSRLRHEQHQVTWVGCDTGDGDGHAGFTETSLMLHLTPDRVNMARAAPGNIAPLEELLPVLVVDGVRAVSPSGVLGDPTAATAEAGRRVLQTMIEDACDKIEHGEPGADGRLRVARAGRR